MDKPSIRNKLSAARRSAVQQETPQERLRRAQDLAKQCLALEQLQSAEGPAVIVASYESLPSEPPTTELNEALLAAGFRVILPVHEAAGRLLEGLHWRDATSDEIVAEETAQFARLSVCVVFTPALAIGRDGTRLGKGKGYYDQFFERLPRHPVGPLRVALIGPSEIFDSLPVDDNDQPIDDWVIG